MIQKFIGALIYSMGGLSVAVPSNVVASQVPGLFKEGESLFVMGKFGLNDLTVTAVDKGGLPLNVISSKPSRRTSYRIHFGLTLEGKEGKVHNCQFIVAFSGMKTPQKRRGIRLTDPVLQALASLAVRNELMHMEMDGPVFERGDVTGYKLCMTLFKDQTKPVDYPISCGAPWPVSLGEPVGQTPSQALTDLLTFLSWRTIDNYLNAD